jgi:hypothetical protein
MIRWAAGPENTCHGGPDFVKNLLDGCLTDTDRHHRQTNHNKLISIDILIIYLFDRSLMESWGGTHYMFFEKEKQLLSRMVNWNPENENSVH